MNVDALWSCEISKCKRLLIITVIYIEMHFPCLSMLLAIK